MTQESPSVQSNSLRWWHSLRYRLPIYLASVILAVTAVATFVSSRIMQIQGEALVNQNLQSVAQNGSNQISGYFADRAQFIKDLGTQSDVILLLEASNERFETLSEDEINTLISERNELWAGASMSSTSMSEEDLEMMIEFEGESLSELVSIISSDNASEAIIIVNKYGALVGSNYRPGNYDYRGANWFGVLDQNEISFNPRELNKFQPSISASRMTRPIVDNRGDIIGYVSVAFDFDEIKEIIIGFKSSLSARASLVNEESEWIYATSYQNRIQPARAPRFFNANGLTRFTQDEINYIAVRTPVVLPFSTLEDPRMSVIMIDEESNALAPVTDARLQAIFFSLFIGAVLIIIFYRIYIRRLVTDLQMLRLEAEEVIENPNPISRQIMKRRDELGILAQAFTSMSQTIRNQVRDQEDVIADRTETLKKQTNQLEVALDIGQETSTGLELDRLMLTAVEKIQSRFNYYLVSLYLYDPQKRVAVLKKAAGVPAIKLIHQDLQIPIGDPSLIGKCLQDEEIQIETDTTTSNIYREHFLMPDTRSEAVLPLHNKGKLLGVLDVQSREPERFSADDIDILRLIGDQVAAAIDNANLYQTMDQRATKQRDVISTWHKISNLQDAHQIFQTVCTDLVETFGMDGAYIARIDHDSLLITHSVGPKSKLRPIQTERPIEYRPWGLVIEENQPILFSSKQSAQFLRYDLDLPPLAAEAIVPIQNPDGIVGLIGAYKLSQHGFEDTELSTIALLASATGSTLATAELLNARKNSIAELSRLYDQITRTETLFETVEEVEYKVGDIPEESSQKLILPLDIRDKTIGNIIVNVDKSEWSQEQEDLLTIISRQAGLALENSQLFAQTQLRLSEQEKLGIQLQTAAEVAAALGGYLNQEELMQRTLDLVQMRFGLYYVGIFLLDEDGRYAHLAAGTGKAGREQLTNRHKLEVGGRSLIGGAVSDGQPRVYQDVYEAEEWFANPNLPDTRSEIALPLRARGRIVGGFTAQSIEIGKFSTDLVRALQTMCDQIAIALDNSLLFTRLESQIEHTGLINQAEQQFINAETKDQISRALIDYAREIGLFQFIQLSTEVETQSGERMITREWIDPKLTKADYFGRHFDLESVDYVERTRLQTINDVSQSPIFDQHGHAFFRHLGLKQGKLIPLTSGREWLGSLLVATTEDELPNREEIDALTMLSRQAARGMASINLIRETSALYGLSRTLSQAISQEDVARITINEIVTHTHIDQCRVFLMDRESDQAYLLASHTQMAEVPPPFSTEQDDLVNTLRQTRKPLIMRQSNYRLSQSMIQRYLAPFGIRTSLVIPAFSQFNLVGFILLDSYDAHWQPTESQQRFSQTAAEQFIVTFENMVLFNEALTRAQEMVAINQIASRIASTLETEEIARIVQEGLLGLVPHDFFLMAVRESSVTFRTLYWVDEQENSSAVQFFDISQELEAQLSANQVVITPADDPLIAPIGNLLNVDMTDYKKAATITFTSENNLSGIIFLASSRSSSLNTDHIQLLRAIANQTGFGISNASLLKETRENVAELRTLFNVTQAIASSVSAEDRMHNTISTLQISLRMAEVAIVSATDEHVLDLVTSTDRPPSLPATLLDTSTTFVKRVFNQSKPYWPHKEDSQQHASHFYPNLNSEVTLPLSIGKRTIGFLSVGHQAENAFNERDLRMLQTVCIGLAATMESGRLFEQINAANERLQELDKLKTQFLANMSHELRTPLNSIIGFSRLILKGIDGPITEAQEEDLNSIYHSGQHLLNLINDILDLAKIDAGKMSITPESIDLHQMADSVHATARGLVHEKGLELRWEVEPDLPIIEADQMRLRQILLNLISNAAKFTESGYVALSMERSTDAEGYIHFAVEDTGIGIDSKDFSKLFNQFEQIDASPTRAMGGTGLGLPIVAELVQLHGGRIWVESEVGVGSKFHVLIPVSQIDPTDSTLTSYPYMQPSQSNSLIKGESAGNNGHSPISIYDLATHSNGNGNGKGLGHETPAKVYPAILLVDDEPGILTLYRRYLSHLPNEIVTAGSGPEALERIKERPGDFGLVLLDIHMPSQSGWDVLQEIRRVPALEELPVIVCSVDITQNEAESNGAQLALTKPIISDDLTRVLDLIKQP